MKDTKQKIIRHNLALKRHLDLIDAKIIFDEDARKLIESIRHAKYDRWVK